MQIDSAIEESAIALVNRAIDTSPTRKRVVGPHWAEWLPNLRFVKQLSLAGGDVSLATILRSTLHRGCGGRARLERSQIRHIVRSKATIENR